MSVNTSLLLAHYNVLKNNYRVVITHTGGTAMGQITSITSAVISVANITSLQATPV
jgi:hypothetical protein